MPLLAEELPPILVRVLAFAFGALWGSFFNVAIHRWPRGESVVHPPSHCPGCGAPIPGWRNVPIFGWLMLRGKAACCGAPISPRYPLVELLGAVLCVAVAERYVVRALPGAALDTAALEALLYFAFVGGLLIATFVDLEFMEIPDEVSLPGAALGLATVSFRGEPGAAAAAFGAGVGFLLIQVVFVWVYETFTGRRGMGEGDAKLMLFIGAFLGWKGVLFALVAGAIQGTLIAVPTLLVGGGGDDEGGAPAAEGGDDDAPDPGTDAGDGDEDAEAPPDEPAPAHAGHLKVPFGPFLALGALEFLFFGDPILDWYVGLLTV